MVTNDRIDVITVDDDADYVWASDGTAFQPFVAPWTAGPFYSLP